MRPLGLRKMLGNRHHGAGCAICTPVTRKQAHKRGVQRDYSEARVGRGREKNATAREARVDERHRNTAHEAP